MMEGREQGKSESVTQQVRCRPLWQRVVYPIIGAVLIILGIIGWLVPIVAGVPLIIIGLPLFVCANPRLEAWLRRKMHEISQTLRGFFRKKGSNSSL